MHSPIIQGASWLGEKIVPLSMASNNLRLFYDQPWKTQMSSNQSTSTWDHPLTPTFPLMDELWELCGKAQWGWARKRKWGQSKSKELFLSLIFPDFLFLGKCSNAPISNFFQRMISRIFLFVASWDTGHFLADVHHPVISKRTSYSLSNSNC